MRKIFFLFLFPFFIVSCSNSNNKEKDTPKAEKKDSLNDELHSAGIKTLNEQLKTSPNNPHLYYQRGLLYLGFKDFEAAEADALRALKIDSLSNDSFYILLTNAYFYAGKTRLAKETLDRCIKNIENATQAYLRLAEIFFYVKKYQECITNVNKALKINPNLAIGYFIKGMCYKESGDTSVALSSFQTACEQDDQYYDAFVETGRLLAAKHNPLCIEYFNKALKINQTAEVVYFVAKFFQDSKRIPQAIDAYNKLLSIEPKNQNALYNMGVIHYIYLKDINKAKGYFTQAIDANAEYADAYLARGICYEDQNNLSEAEADYKMATQNRTNYEAAIMRLNALLEKRKGK
ncbi:MAG: tetratricopeptide repeat protein [Bacteroidetes bacterium]|nr:tetratricopeptide repeat protein [Bacteroidota bacterium]